MVHKAQLQESNEAFLAWSKNVGKATQEVIELYFQEDRSKGQIIKLCRGLQHLARRYGGERLNAACNRGLQTGAISFKALESILKKGLENISLPMDEEHTAFVSTHKNLRGKSYYY